MAGAVTDDPVAGVGGVAVTRSPASVDSRPCSPESAPSSLSSPDSPLTGLASGETGARLIVHLNGKRIETTIPHGATILDVMVREKHDAPYSCTAGACSTCMAKVIQGKVKMDACYALDDEEVKAGYCLTCQSHAETELVEISYDM